jgi:hypothetical protein
MPILNGVNVCKSDNEAEVFERLDETRAALDVAVGEALSLGNAGNPQQVQRIAALIRTKLDEAELWLNALVLRP